MDAFQILVIILAVFLAIFLLLGIILLVKLIKISRAIRIVADNIGEASDSLRAAADNLYRLSSPIILGKIVIKYLRKYLKGRRRL